tara:strand:- start:254 stop:775 length:522 start_codon:yes stop_codon:yes gene_type:complete
MGAIINSFTGFSGIKRRFLIGAVVAILCGAGWNGGEWLMDSYKGSKITGSMESGIQKEWNSGSKKRAEMVNRGHQWSNALIAIGLSFIGAMVVGSLLRVFFKGMLTLVIIAALTLLFCHYKGIADPVIDPFLSSVDEVFGWAKNEGKSFWVYLMEVVPSAGAALVGLGFGLKK